MIIVVRHTEGVISTELCEWRNLFQEMNLRGFLHYGRSDRMV